MENTQAQARKPRIIIVDYIAFAVLFAAVSIAVAVALGGIVLLLTPPSETTTNESTAAQADTALPAAQFEASR